MKNAVSEWMERAEEDLKVARYLYNGKFWADASFHSEQSVEKALKALYRVRFKNIPKTHDIVMLAKRLNLSGSMLDCCDSLKQVYMPARYPEVAIIKRTEFSEKSAKEDIKCAEEVLAWIKRQLNSNKS